MFLPVLRCFTWVSPVFDLSGPVFPDFPDFWGSGASLFGRILWSNGVGFSGGLSVSPVYHLGFTGVRPVLAGVIGFPRIIGGKSALWRRAPQRNLAVRRSEISCGLAGSPVFHLGFTGVRPARTGVLRFIAIFVIFFAISIAPERAPKNFKGEIKNR